MNVVEGFCLVSGLRLNKEKCMLASVNIGKESAQILVNALGCLISSWPLKYLGLPLGGEPSLKDFWALVLEKLTRRLEG
ncbi:hypothetical protein Sjap_005488 [Stephania japonica]|uniref:Reverse transcriptase domain-containing protein n=1 Tax=Stephania japonica TaxID=461633 RepID=A0AAP0PL67_9MAGN